MTRSLEKIQSAPNRTGRRLAAAVLGYIVVVIFLLTWNPFSFALPEHLSLSLHVGPRDAFRNVLLFLPVGFLYRLTWSSRGGSTPLKASGAVLLGLAVSATAEVVQLFIPGRTPSAVDLTMNTLGAWVGAVLHDLIANRIAMTPRLVGQLSLETPLMGLLYLLVPLLWVNRLIRDDASRWWLTALIGLCGAILLSDITQQWWGPVKLLSAWRVMLAAGAWFFVGTGQSLLRYPVLGSVCLVGISLITAILAMIPRPSTNRRFERTTLRRLVLAFILYLFLQALWPPFQTISSWHMTLGLVDPLAQEKIQVNVRLLEHLAAFTVLGYITAEWRGRDELRWRQDLPRLLLIALVSALTLEALIGFQAGPGASFLRPMIAISGALFGGAIYHLQRDHVRFLLSRPTIS